MTSNPPAPVKSISTPKRSGKVVLVPNPTIAGNPAKPSAIEVGATGNPDANGMIAPSLAGPTAPVGPVSPVVP